jgi:uncharacterized protein YecE (DUF72 family)
MRSESSTEWTRTDPISRGIRAFYAARYVTALTGAGARGRLGALMPRARGRLRVGTSGYQYDHWRVRFYPRGLPKRRWLEHYASHFDTVEINNTFYQLPSEHTFDAWRGEVPEGFCFALKFSRYGSHLKRLKQPEDSIGHFLERARRLGTALGPILVQLPPRWSPDPGRLAAFLDAAPRSHRFAVEFRDPRWLCEPVYRILRRHRAALCVHDLIERHPREITADWVYLRFHGERYAGSYSHQFLTAEAARIRRELRRGLDVYAYFNNDVGGHAVRNALDLRRYAQGG